MAAWVQKLDMIMHDMTIYFYNSITNNFFSFTW